MVNIKDYKSYVNANKKFLKLLKDNSSLVYDRLSDLLKVLEFVETLVDQKKKIDGELKTIFDVGFSFLHEQLEQIKIYYNVYFQKDLLKLKEYEILINYTLYIDDLEEVLKEKKKFKKEIKEDFEKIKAEIDDILRNKETITIDRLNEYNLIIEEHVAVGTHTILEVYAMIVEELQI